MGAPGRTVSLPALSLVWRMVLTLTVLAMVAFGTARGNDDWWPFAPMSQYAFLVRNDGVINSLYMEARTPSGEIVPVHMSGTTLGIERSEMEGLLNLIVREPYRLQAIAVLHARRQPDQPRFVEIFLRNRQTQLDANRSVRIIDLASWTVLDPEHPEDAER